jgi:hypothetical protein
MASKTSRFAPARRTQMKLRMALHGPDGSGKTMTSFTLMRELVGWGGNFAVIDTEGRAQEYAVLRDGDPETDYAFKFGHVAPRAADPTELPELIRDAAESGYQGLVVDSYTHYWSGVGGALDRVDKARDKRAGWGDYRLVESRFMSALASFPGHVILTMRTKIEYVPEYDERLRQTVVRRLGTKPDQRDSATYDCSIVGMMDNAHAITFTKASTCQELTDVRIELPGAGLAATLAAWLGEGDPAVSPTTTLRDRALDPNVTMREIREIWFEVHQRGLQNDLVNGPDGESYVPLGSLVKARGDEVQMRTATSVPR